MILMPPSLLVSIAVRQNLIGGSVIVVNGLKKHFHLQFPMPGKKNQTAIFTKFQKENKSV